MPCLGGDGLDGTDPWKYADRDVRIGRILGGLEDGGRHAEYAGVAPGDHRNRRAALGELKSVPGTVDLDGVARGVADQAFPLRHPVDIGAVADDVIDPGQRGRRFRSEQPSGPGPKPITNSSAAGGFTGRCSD